MPRYTRSSIDEVLRRSDFPDIAAQYVQLRRNGSDFVGLCPFHREKTPSFHINADKQLYYCFGCAGGGNLIDFIMKIENLDFVDAIKFLADRAGVTLEEEEFSPAARMRHNVRERLLKMNKIAAKHFVRNLTEENAQHAREYAAHRRLTPETLTAFGIGYAKDEWSDLLNHLRENGFSEEEIVNGGLAAKSEKGRVYDKFRNRLMFPVIDVRGNVIAFSGRTLGEDGAKYMNSPETEVYHKGDHIFGLNLAKQRSQTDGVILTEGNLDAVSLHAHGFRNAVAGLGTALTENQASLLRRYTSLVYLCYDNDGAGEKAVEKAIDLLSRVGLKLRVITLKDAKDPDEYLKTKGREMFRKLITSAPDATEYRLMMLRRNFDLTDSGGKIAFIEKAAEVLSQNENAVEREIYAKRIAKETDVSADSILTQINGLVYRRQHREVKKQQSRVQSTRQIMPRQSGNDRKAADTASYKTERMLLNLMFFSNPAFRIAQSEVNKDAFSSSVHQSLFGEIVSFKQENDESCDASLFLADLTEPTVKTAAADILYKEYMGDATEAIRDNIQKLNKQNFDRTIARLAKEGNTEEINKLLKAQAERRTNSDGS